MTRLLIFLMMVMLVTAAALGLKACQDGRVSIGRKATPPHADLSSIVVLDTGSVLTAPKGTVGRDLLDWLASPDRTERYFELGGREFVGRSAEPTPESRVRIERLVEMLRAHRDVHVTVIGFTASSGNEAADLHLSRLRAEWISRSIHAGGIAGSRLSAEGRGGADPIGDNKTAEGRARNERAALLVRSTR